MEKIIKNPVITHHEANYLATPYPDLIIRLVRQKKIIEAIAMCDEMKESQVLLHDFFADSCAILWSWIGEKFGEDSVEKMFRYVFAQSAGRQFFDVAGVQVPPHLAVILLAKSWRAHSCFGAGEFPAKFSITEDHEKFTFHLHPCGSGMRLWQKGFYNKGRGGKLSGTAHSWTYNREGFPYYCIHCPFLNEVLPYESGLNALMWPVDPPGKPGDTCAWHIYKDFNAIPNHYYERLGLSKNILANNRYLSKDRTYFTQAQLIEMARPMTDRIQEKIRKGDLSGAITLCRNVKDEFLVLHDLYVNMLATTFSFIAKTQGEDALGEALEFQFENCVKEQLVSKINTLSPKEKIGFLAGWIFGTDNCNGMGYFKGKFSLWENENEIIFTLDPCGSGGRLIRAGSQAPMPWLKKLQEKLENTIVNLACRFLPLPETILEFAFPLVVKHYTQRKPYGQGKTQAAHPWSFDATGVPFYCCQCGTIQKKLGTTCLRIFPPTDKVSPCVWKIDKKALMAT